MLWDIRSLRPDELQMADVYEMMLGGADGAEGGIPDEDDESGGVPVPIDLAAIFDTTSDAGLPLD